MIDGKKVLAVIPARGGSKGIKDKNIRIVAGKPLIAHTILAGFSSKYIDDIYVSTDSRKILDVANRYGIKNKDLRPAELALDTSKSIDALIHSLKMNPGFDIIVFLQPTSPCRKASDIDSALEVFESHNELSLVSCVEEDINPYLLRFEGSEDKAIRICDHSSTIRRQDAKKVYRVNGAIYINKVSEINGETSLNDNEVMFKMSIEDSVDIDTMDDLKTARKLLGDRK